jgi:hypothetical protein
VNLSESPTDLHDDAIGYNPVGNGVVNGEVEGNGGSNGALQAERPRSQGQW